MQKRLRFEYPDGVKASLWGILSPLIVALVVSIVASIVCVIAEIAPETLDTNPTFHLITNAITQLGFLSVALILAHKTKTNIVEATGLKTTSPWWIYILCAVLAIAISLLLNPIIASWQELLSLINFNVPDLPIEVNSVGNLFLLLGLMAVLPAICEELLFRGVLLNSLRKYGAVVSIFLSATFFSLMHMSLLQLPYTFALGVLLGIVVYYTRNLTLSMIMHFTNNAFVLILEYLTYGQAQSAFPWYMVLIGLAGVAIFVLIIYFVAKLLNKVCFAKTQSTEQQYLAIQQDLPQKVRKSMWLMPSLVAGFCLIIMSLVSFGVL